MEAGPQRSGRETDKRLQLEGLAARPGVQNQVVERGRSGHFESGGVRCRERGPEVRGSRISYSHTYTWDFISEGVLVDPEAGFPYKSIITLFMCM